MIGVAIITCDRPDFFEKCYAALDRDFIDVLYVIDDGNEKIKWDDSRWGKYLTTPKPRSGVGVAKSIAIDALMNAEGTDYISFDRPRIHEQSKVRDLFLIEDDILVKDNTVFLQYRSAKITTGIQHFMFGYHGPANKTGSKGQPLCKHKFDYGGFRLLLNQHCVGGFCYYSRLCIEEVGNFDLTYNNAFEHIDHSYRIAKAGMTTPYWNWADINNSWEYLDELACSEESSAIRGRSDWRPNIEAGFKHFVQKHKVSPYEVPDTSETEIIKQLKKMYEKYRYLR